MSDKLQVWSCGGGTQSCAIGALIVQGKLPKPDFSVIADTGYETGATWEYMDKVLRPELAGVGVELIRLKAKDYSTHPNPIMIPRAGGKNAFLVQIPAFTMRGFSKAKLTNYCTTKWKIDVLTRFLLRKHGLKRPECCYWIGFSKDEQRRWVRMQMKPEWKRGMYALPLVEQYPLSRQEAIKVVTDIGWPTPPRSACYFCPNHSDHEWRKLKSERPDEFQQAVEWERQIQKTDPEVFLHIACVPLDQVDFSQPEDLFSRPCDSGMCFV